MANQADIGLIGLAVMGQNLVLNMNDNGYTVAVFNRTIAKVDTFLEGPAKGTKVIGSHSIEEFCKELKSPRKIMMMVKAGDPVDQLIEELMPFLEKGDVLIDGGNSHYPDTTRRCQDLAKKGILFVGAGVSGGEEGARHGPSIMPGGNKEAWPQVKEILQAIAAKADDGKPCCDWVGEDGAGHYVKMVHNGIEYGDMQLICEGYQILHEALGLNFDELHQTFDTWNKGKLDSYLIEITSQIFEKKDEDGSVLLEKILDVAGQKGTGKWTGISALDIGMPLTLIGEAVFARCLSALKDERIKAAKLFGHEIKTSGDKKEVTDAVRDGLYAAKLTSYAQGFMLMRQAGIDNKWTLNLSGVALMWRGGCIIRSRFLNNISEAFEKNKDLSNLMLDDFFKKEIEESAEGWRKAVLFAMNAQIPVPCLSSALSFFDGIRCERLPANLLQAQRDFFGAHTYERADKPRGKFFHTDWTGSGGDAHSGSYNA